MTKDLRPLRARYATPTCGPISCQLLFTSRWGKPTSAGRTNLAPSAVNALTNGGVVTPSAYNLSRGVPSTIDIVFKSKLEKTSSLGFAYGVNCHRTPRFNVNRGFTLKLSCK